MVKSQSFLASAKIAYVSLTIDPSLASGSVPTLYLGSGDFIHGIDTILYYIARVATVPSFYGQDAIHAAHVDQWLEHAPVILSGSEFEAACSFLDGFLVSRTFLVGYSLSIADNVVWSNIAGIGQRWESLRRSKKYQNLIRWFNSIAVDYAGMLDEVVAAYVGKRGIGKSPAPILKEKVQDLKGKAYVDDTPKEQMRNERKVGVESKCRNNTVEENLSLWREMVNGTESGMRCYVRAKLDMLDPNKPLRDPVYYRCNTVSHHRVGSKYKVYPTYDFACPFVDASEGVTHALRSSEHHDRNAQYYRILQDMGLRRLEIFEFSRLNMVYTLLSKRKLLGFVQNKTVDGWTDPRFPTIQGIVRRGLKIEALIQFILEQGASKNLNLMEWDKLWTVNKKIIDPVCARHTAVLKDQRVLLTLTNGPEEPFIRILPRHKKYEGAGNKATTFTNRIWLEYADASVMSTGQEVTLMDLGNTIIKEIKTENGIITQMVGELHLEGSVKSTKLKLTWLPDIEDLLEEEEEITIDNLNPCTRRETSALGDPNMQNLKRGEIIQIERKGYYRCDVPFIRLAKSIVLFSIPDGRRQSAANNESFHVFLGHMNCKLNSSVTDQIGMDVRKIGLITYP
ncbi:Glutamate--tRNA ligase, cytoplasmic [Dichanthelium oligosanthes]|uniref:Glutamate--tRNA ligase, cytoplasmic n=1 Tax=Dichanthelium oligosanthes TaxID=888268 RepID=A0A1E5ULH3_9POAL|nr:Glutamate--tRNA ligase, cytoplasmic [Dichanthelium oligosanthes]